MKSSIAVISFFGSLSRSLAEVVQEAGRRWGLPNGYILGQEASGAFVGGLRYGEGKMYTRNAGDEKVYLARPVDRLRRRRGRRPHHDAGLNLPGKRIYRRFGGIDGRLISSAASASPRSAPTESSSCRSAPGSALASASTSATSSSPHARPGILSKCCLLPGSLPKTAGCDGATSSTAGSASWLNWQFSVLLGFLAAALIAVLAIPAISGCARRLAKRTRACRPRCRKARPGRNATHCGASTLSKSCGWKSVSRCPSASAGSPPRRSAASPPAFSRSKRTPCGIMAISLRSAPNRRPRRRARRSFGPTRRVTGRPVRHGRSQRDRFAAALSASRARVLDLETAADESRTRIATLETRITGLDIELGDLQRLLSEQTSLHLKFERSATDLAAELTEFQHVSEKLKALQADFARSEKAREDAVLENGQQFARIAASESAAAQAEAARADLARRLEAAEAADAGTRRLSPSACNR